VEVVATVSVHSSAAGKHKARDGGLKRSSDGKGGAFTFRVSDVVDVPLRGLMLRLRLVNGTPSMADLTIGSTLRLRSPDGVERDARVIAHAVTGGVPTQQRLDRVRELDVLIDDDSAAGAIEIGWMASGPVG
jgi:hypothetical protein